MSGARRLPPHGLAGLVVIAAAEVLLAAGAAPVRTFFTPIVWTGYILAADGAVYALSGRSQLVSDRVEFLRTALLSVPIWLVFEAYNLRLRNWEYVGLPDALPWRLLGYAWSFATILPALFETSDVVLAVGVVRDAGRAPRGVPSDADAASAGARVALVVLGGLCLVLPLLVLDAVAPYLFGLVWIGFIFLLDPINASLGRWAASVEWSLGRRRRLLSLLASGLVCGFLWEFWNYWAGAKWVYTFPILQRLKIFEMPLAGFLGFPPFAVECFLMYDLLSGAWRGGWGRSGSAPRTP